MQQGLNYQFENEAFRFSDCHSIAVVWICRSHLDLLHHDYNMFSLLHGFYSSSQE